MFIVIIGKNHCVFGPFKTERRGEEYLISKGFGKINGDDSHCWSKDSENACVRPVNQPQRTRK